MSNRSQENNQNAWQHETYTAYSNKYGKPEEASEKILKNPEKILFPIYEYMGDVKGKKIANLMGSTGHKAIALTLLGATVDVYDLSEGNQKYAEALAKACGTNIEYIVTDVLEIDVIKTSNQYDIVFAEMGILHYFTDLEAFISIAYKILESGGQFIIRDFHPISTKLITSKGSTAKVRKHKVSGDYFSEELYESEVAYSKYDENGEKERVYLRKWTLGEIITSLCNVGFVIKVLREEPNLSSDVFDKGIPKTFTIVCMKA